VPDSRELPRCGLLIRTQILPAIGKVRLARLTTAQLDHFYARLRERGGRDDKPLAPATVRQVHAIVRRALQQGVRWGWIASNAASLASPPWVRRSQLEPPDPGRGDPHDRDRCGGGPGLRVLPPCCGHHGRRGELYALRWRDVDLKARSITISRAVVEGVNKVVTEKDTKTHASRRIAIDEGTAASLQEQLERATARAQACDLKLSPNATVFSRRPDGGPWSPNDATKAFIRLRKAVGLPNVRLHDLRHFTATQLLAAGVPVRTVSGRLVHANASTTLSVYANSRELHLTGELCPV